MQTTSNSKTFKILVSFVVFMVVFGRDGHFAAGFFVWLFFVLYVMPLAWR